MTMAEPNLSRAIAVTRTFSTELLTGFVQEGGAWEVCGLTITSQVSALVLQAVAAGCMMIGVASNLAIGPQTYRGTNLLKPRTTSRAVFGGQVIAQSLMAAVESVSDPDFLLHSCHCYFLGPVQSSSDMVYRVDESKDGRSFSSRSVKALQGEKLMFQCLVLFRRGSTITSFVDHSGQSMPSVPRPDDVEVKSGTFVQRRALGVESCPCFQDEQLENKTAGRANEPRYLMWVRGKNGPSEADHQNVHRVALSYMSDLYVMFSFIYKFPEFASGFQTSLDHSVWFHAPVHASEWYLLVMDCDHAIGESALNACRIFGEDGTLVATCKQEGLIRPKL